MVKTSVPIVNRSTLFSGSTQIVGYIPIVEPVGTIVYVYVNTKRAGTVPVTSNQVLIDGIAYRSWSILIKDLSLGTNSIGLRRGDKIYFQARAIEKERSDSSRIYSVDGIDQPSAPYVLENYSVAPRAIYERDRYISGDIPLIGNSQRFLPNKAINLEAGAGVSIYINGTYLTSVQSDENGHWTFDLFSVPDSPLLPLSKNDIVTVRANRYYVNQSGNRIEVLAPSAESVPAEVLTDFFQTKLFDYIPSPLRHDDQESGDLRSFIKILGLSMDEIKSLIDQFTDIFNLDRCDPKYFDVLAALLGFPLNKLDSIELQRFQLKNAVEFWKRKGTIPVFKVLFYMLNYSIEVVELWTNDYKMFYPTIMNSLYTDYVYVDSQDRPIQPPDTAPELIENGGTWYRSPYFGIQLQPLVEMVPTPSYPYGTDPIACPMESSNASISLSLDDIRYLIERIDFFRPAHTVMDYIAFTIPLIECGPIPEELVRWDVRWQPQGPAWFPPYCEPDDPIYFRDGVTSTRSDRKGTITLGVTRDPAGVFPSTHPKIKMKRLPERGYCHPGEILEFELQPTDTEYYYYYPRRDGLGIGGYPLGDPIIDPDMNDFPSRNAFNPPTRDGKSILYPSRLQITLQTIVAP